jgi:hypothetical protein
LSHFYFNGYFPFVALDDFHCSLLLAYTFFVVFGRVVGITSNQVQGVGYSESKMETDMTALELEMDTTASDQVVSQEISN